MLTPRIWHIAEAAYVAYVVAFNSRVFSMRVKDVITAAPRNRSEDNPDPLTEYVGLIHLHSEYSRDAQGTYAELAATAGKQGIDFIIVTDHNTMKAVADGRQGWYDKTLMLTGVESSRKEGFLLCFDVPEQAASSSADTHTLLSRVENAGGLAFLAHAENSHWPWKGVIDDRIAGLEIVDLADQVYDAPLLTKIMAGLYFPANRLFAFLHLYRRPRSVIALWDRVGAHRNFVGIFASDIHQNLTIFRWRFKFPRAELTMPFAYNHLLCEKRFSGSWEEDRKIVYEAIRRGHLFMAVELLGDARGFMFSAAQGSKTAIMGDALPARETTLFSIDLPEIESQRDVRVHVYRGGKQILIRDAAPFTFSSSLPGAYRVEVTVNMPTFWGPKRQVTWIFSNPIYLR